MLDDFTPIIHTLPGRDARIYAVSDVHIGAREADIDGFSKFLRRVESEPDSYIVICGDVLNNGIRDSITNVYEETMPPSAQVDLAAELLAPLAHKVLGCVGGNHERRSAKAVDLDPMFQVMTLIGKPDLYRPNMAFIRVTLKNDNASKDQYALLLVHGKTENKKRHFARSVEGVDAIISGHTHNGLIEKPTRICFTKQNNVVMKSIVSLTATSWLKYGGYAAAGLLLPNTTGNPQSLLLEFKNSNDVRGNIRVAW